MSTRGRKTASLHMSKSPARKVAVDDCQREPETEESFYTIQSESRRKRVSLRSAKVSSRCILDSQPPRAHRIRSWGSLLPFPSPYRLLRWQAKQKRMTIKVKSRRRSRTFTWIEGWSAVHANTTWNERQRHHRTCLFSTPPPGFARSTSTILEKAFAHSHRP